MGYLHRGLRGGWVCYSQMGVSVNRMKRMLRKGLVAEGRAYKDAIGVLVIDEEAFRADLEALNTSHKEMRELGDFCDESLPPIEATPLSFGVGETPPTFAITDEDDQWVSMFKACESMGLDRFGLRKRIKAGVYPDIDKARKVVGGKTLYHIKTLLEMTYLPLEGGLPDKYL